MGRFLIATLLASCAMPAFADDVSVAVAANFTEAAEEIATAFNAAHRPHRAA